MNKRFRAIPQFLLVTFCFILINQISTQAIWAVEERPKSILYITAKPGCYSAAFISLKTTSMAAPKRIFQVNCFTYHHYEVFWSGIFKTRPGNPIPNSKDSASFCLQKSNSLTYSLRTSISYNYGPNETIGIGNWLADKGPEATRFPKRLVCYVGLSTDEFRIFKEVNKPMIRNMK